MKFWKRFKSALFNIYVASNMLLCSILFVGFSKPRETISGCVGRTLAAGANSLASREDVGSLKFKVLNVVTYALLYLALFIDWCFGEKGHCGETAQAEDNMRSELYPELEEGPAQEGAK
jgi:hypothetical protein